MGLRTIREAADLIRARKLSPREVLEECLHTIDRQNPVLNAFITVTVEAALEQAKHAETEIQAGRWRGPLHGIPIGLKDLIDTAGVRTTAASALFADRVPDDDAELVKLLKAAGAVIIGKQNLHEFAYGASSLISHFGPVRNPANTEYIAGGSSGGSAAAVASGMGYGAIGTDTAGSVREPAALCGVVGLKPGYGLLSMRGIIPLSPSLDHAGVITRTAEDAAILLDALAQASGKYRDDSCRERKDWAIGVPRDYFFEDLDEEVEAKAEAALRELFRSASRVCEITLPVSTDRALQAAEAYDWHRENIRRSPELYHPETLARIQGGENITPGERRKAREDLKEQRRKAEHIFEHIDILVMPTVPRPSIRISDLTKDLARLRPAELFLLRNTRPVNVWGLPAISIPCGTTREGLPVGLQIVGPPGGEGKVLGAARQYEQLAGGYEGESR
ncbi:MAG: amidase [Acidobacteria bacterium]|nr:amidase [Acidobacteriota bacterium]MBV9625098.1 amidase [Acidobacteriota bacterium]